MSNPTVQPATPQHRDTVANLMQLYLHDLSEYEELILRPDGLFELGRHFDAYWDEDERHPFLIWDGERLAGFAFVREIERGTYSMAEFFVTRGVRGTGLAARAATALFDRFRGEWHVAQMARNAPAQRFWRRVIHDYTNGKFEEELSVSEPRGIKQVFSNVAGATR